MEIKYLSKLVMSKKLIIELKKIQNNSFSLIELKEILNERT